MEKTRVKCEFDDCDKEYCSLFNLKRHIQSFHQGIKRFKCQTCGKQLSSKQNFIDHQNIHTSAKPYFCDYPGCYLRFRQLSQFYMHIKIHGLTSSHSIKPLDYDDIMLKILARKLSEDKVMFYFLPTGPYCSENIKIPEIQSLSERDCKSLDSSISLVSYFKLL
jgi:uncharacterized Zn-finger protein